MTIDEFKQKQAELTEYIVLPETIVQDRMTAIGITVFVLAAAIITLANESTERLAKLKKERDQ